MKNILLFSFILFLTSFFSAPVFAASINAPNKTVITEKKSEVKKEFKNLRKQQKAEKKLNRFQQKLNKKIAKLKKKGKLDASFDLNTISLIVLLLGGLFIFLGIVLSIPIVGTLFIVIGALIAFAGLVMLLLLDGAKIRTSSPSH